MSCWSLLVVTWTVILIVNVILFSIYRSRMKRAERGER